MPISTEGAIPPNGFAAASPKPGIRATHATRLPCRTSASASGRLTLATSSPPVRPSRAAKAREPSVPSSSTSATSSGERPSGGAAKITPKRTASTIGQATTKKKSPRCRVSSRRSFEGEGEDGLHRSRRARSASSSPSSSRIWVRARSRLWPGRVVR